MTRRFLLTLILISFAIAAPVWWAIGTMWPVATDIIFYSTVLKHFSAQFWSGDLYPRWLDGANAGLGSPVFVYYPPAAFYIASLFQWLSPVDPHGLGRFVICVQLAVIACGISAYYWLRQTLSERQAQKGGLIYAAFPSIALVLYYDYGMPQLWALAQMPLLLLLFTHRLCQNRPGAFHLLALSYALLALTHLPSTLIFCLVPLCYAAFFAPKGKQLQLFLKAGCAGALGALIASFSLIPSRLAEEFIMTHYFLSGNGDYVLNFWKVRNLVAVFIVMLPLAGFFMELPKPRKQFISRQVVFWMGVIAAGIFMTSYLSKFLWDTIPPLRYMQFPWRMMIVAIPAAAYIMALWLEHVKSKSFMLVFCVLIFSINGYAGASSLFFESPKPLGDTLKHSLITSKEYTTRWMQEQGIGTYKFMPEEVVNLPQASLINGRGHVDIVSWHPGEIVLKADIESREATVKLRRFYFPGWQTQQATVTPCEALMCLSVPSGEQLLTLRLALPMEKETGWISFLALIFALAGLGYSLRNHRKNA